MLTTKRLRLRNLCGGDVNTIFDYRNDVRCNRYQRYTDTTKEYLEGFVKEYSHSLFLSLEPEQHYAIVLNRGSEMIGDLSVFFTPSDNCFTLGITIAPLYQSNGYAYELLSNVTALLREKYPSADIVALIDKDNLASISLFKKLKFTEECYAESIKSLVYVLQGETEN